MKTTGKFKKNIGMAVVTLAAVSSISMSAFAGEAKSVPMQKLLISSTTAEAGETAASDKTTGVTTGIPATKFTKITLKENQGTTILTRTNESTGKLEVSKDGGATWSEFDGKAVMTTPAVVAELR